MRIMLVLRFLALVTRHRAALGGGATSVLVVPGFRQHLRPTAATPRRRQCLAFGRIAGGVCERESADPGRARWLKQVSR